MPSGLTSQPADVVDHQHQVVAGEVNDRPDELAQRLVALRALLHRKRLGAAP